MPSPLGKVSPKVTEEVRTFAKQKCIAEGDCCQFPSGKSENALHFLRTPEDGCPFNIGWFK